jgi:hypothetical protein
MSRSYVTPALVALILGALLANVVALRSDPPSLDETADLDGGDPGVDVAEVMEPIDPLAVSSLLLALARSHDRRNPFLTRLEADSLEPGTSAALHEGSGVSSAPRLDGILWSPYQRVAWLDGRPWSEGEIVRGQLIERIVRSTVTLRTNDSRVELHLQPPAGSPRAEGDEANDD